jgi:hypothetical protein
VENQLAEGHAAATATLSRLMSEGLDRHDAIHAIGAIAMAEMFDMLKVQVAHDPEQYARKLQALTAARWRAGFVYGHAHIRALNNGLEQTAHHLRQIRVVRRTIFARPDVVRVRRVTIRTGDEPC